MLNPTHFREHVIRPTLEHLGLWSESAENLLLGTALVESGLTHLVQLGGGPALGVYQMEPATHDDIWKNFLKFRDDLRKRVCDTINLDPGMRPEADRHLIGNLFYATAMARVHYLRVLESLPEADDVWRMAGYWKAYYNTELGKGMPEKYFAAWKRAMK